MTEIPKILQDFLNYNASINKSVTTIYEYKCDIIRLLKFLKWKDNKCDDMSRVRIDDIGSNFFNKIKLEDLYEFISYLTEIGDKPITRARKVSSIRIFFRYLYVKAKVIDDNPAKDLERPKIGKRLPKYLTLEQSKSLLYEIKAKKTVGRQHDNSVRDYAIVTIFLNCGLRLSELVNINLNDINFDDNILTVIGKGDKERAIFLNPACIDAIKDYLKIRKYNRNKKEALFLSERDKRISNRTVQHIIKEYLQLVEGAGNLSTHKLRHTAATLMYQNGVDIRVLKDFLGHESIATTEIYIHVNDSLMREAVYSNPLANFKP